MKALYRAWVKAVEFQKANEKEADEIMARGVGGWLEDAAVFAETRAGIVYYDDATNQAFIGTEAPGGIAKTIVNAWDRARDRPVRARRRARGADRFRHRQPVGAPRPGLAA